MIVSNFLPFNLNILSGTWIYFFLEGTVTNPAIWLVLYLVSTFPSLPISNFIAIFHKYTSFCPLGSIFKQTHRSLPQADLRILSFSLSNQFSWQKILVSEWICIGNGVITSVDKRPKNRLQLILIIHKKYLES